MGRFSVEFEVANHEDVVQARKGFLPPEQVRRARISGVVDTGAARLVLSGLGSTAAGIARKPVRSRSSSPTDAGSPSRLLVTFK